MSDHVFELVKAQIAQRFGREPGSHAEMAEALALLDTPLVAALGARLEMKKLLGRPLLDFKSFGGDRTGELSAVPADGGGSGDPAGDGLAKAGAALDAASRHLIELGRASLDAARADLPRSRNSRGGGGGTFAKRGGAIADHDATDVVDQQRLITGDGNPVGRPDWTRGGHDAAQGQHAGDLEGVELLDVRNVAGGARWPGRAAGASRTQWTQWTLRTLRTWRRDRRLQDLQDRTVG